MRGSDGVVHRRLQRGGARPLGVLKGFETSVIFLGRLEGRGHCVEREIAEPGPTLVFLDESGGFPADSVRQVVEGVDALRAAEDGVGEVARGIEVVVQAVEKSEKKSSKPRLSGCNCGA